MRNEAIRSWVLLVAAHAQPESIRHCDGSDAEWESLCAELVQDGQLLPLSRETHPGSYAFRSAPGDASRPDGRRFVCTPYRAEAGPMNEWLPEDEVYRSIWPLFSGAMRGRTLYVVPYLLGPRGSKWAQVGVQLTDSPLVVARLRLLTRMGREAIDHLGRSGDFVRGLHCTAECDPARRIVVHFPATQTAWSIGSEQAEAAVAGHKWHVLNLVGAQAPEEGFLAQHMTVLALTPPGGRRHFVAAALPSGCGKTQLGMLEPALPGYEVGLVADGMCLLRVGEEGRLWAINPAAGLDSALGRECEAPTRQSLFSDVAVTEDGAPWWQEQRGPAARSLLDGQRRPGGPGAEPAAHPAARVTARAGGWRRLARGFDDPDGVPISAILFGGRRSRLLPLVTEALSWDHGVYLGATLRSEVPPEGGAAGRAALVHDPMAMRPYCAYNMGDHFGHWLRLGRQLRPRPRIFLVNWFRSDDGGRPLWPGFGENIRVLDWVVRRVERSAGARETPIGHLPQSLETRGLALPGGALDELLQVDVGGWLREAEQNEALLAQFGRRLPAGVRREHEALLLRLTAANN